MSKIIDAMRKAKIMRESSAQAIIQDVSTPPTDEPIITKKTILWSALLLGVFMLGAISSGYVRKDPNESLNSIQDKIDQMDKKLSQLVLQYSRLKDSIAVATPPASQGSAATIEATAPYSVQPKEMHQQSELYHTVTRGDSLSIIAKRYHVSVDKLRLLNKLKQKQLLQPGQKLLVTPASH